MIISMRAILSITCVVGSLSFEVTAQEAGADVRKKIDAIILEAYQAAAAKFPCKVKTRGKPKMLRWEKVDRCVNEAAERVDWNDVRRQLEVVRSGEPKMSSSDFLPLVETSLSEHALTYGRVFANQNLNALLPLTNSLLKYRPPGSLQNLPVYDKDGNRRGSFLDTYLYERKGGLASANTYSLTIFQYSDLEGNVQSVDRRLLLDSFGIPWKDVAEQPGFRLPSDKLK